MIISPEMTPDVVLFISLLTLFSGIGTIGNILTLLVYSKRSISLTQKTFVVTLAILDLFVCTIVIPYTVLLELKMITGVVVCHTMEFVRTFSVLASNFALVVIAGERYIAVAKPLHLPSSRKKTIVMVILLLIIVPISIPAGFTFTVTRTNICPGNQTAQSSSLTDCLQYSCGYTTEFLTPTGGDIYKLICTSIFVFSIILIITWYALVYKILYQREKSRRLQRIPFGSGYEQTVKSASPPRKTNFPKKSPNCIRIQPYEELKSCRQDKSKQQSGVFKEASKEDSHDYCIKKSLAIQMDRQVTQQVLGNTLVLGGCKTYLDTSDSVDENQRRVVQDRTLCIHSLAQQIAGGKRETEATHKNDNSGPSTSMTETETEIMQPTLNKKKKMNVDDWRARSRNEVAEPNALTVNSDPELSIADNLARRSEKLSKIFPSCSESTPKIHTDQIHSRSMVHRKTSTMLFICTVIFVFSWIPFWIDVFDITHSLTVRYLFLAGHASNPIVYGIVNAEVRERILDILNCRRRK